MMDGDKNNNAFDDLPDATDWLSTPVSSLAPLEAALRCQVCKDFFNTPVITSCSHTFCSLCIRRCLTNNDGTCPSCRAPDQELRLRPNWAVQELVSTFQLARPQILKLGRDVSAAADNDATIEGTGRRRRTTGRERGCVSDSFGEGTEEEEEQDAASGMGTEMDRRRGKRKRRLQDEEESDYFEDGEGKKSGDATPRRKTRSRTSVRSHGGPVVIPSEEVSEPDDGLAACPICGKRMKEEQVFSHLDIHQGEGDGNGERSVTKPTKDLLSVPMRHENALSIKSRQSKPMERLPQLNYSLLNDNALRKKLEGLGIPNSGNRNLLTKRHIEWVNLVNANCDSRNPRSKRELLHDLEVWDKTQGRRIQNHGSGSGVGGGGTSGGGVGGGPSVMDKDFDGNAWVSKHEDSFRNLIAEARKRSKHSESIKSEAAQVEDTVAPVEDQSLPSVPTAASAAEVGSQGL